MSANHNSAAQCTHYDPDTKLFHIAHSLQHLAKKNRTNLAGSLHVAGGIAQVEDLLVSHLLCERQGFPFLPIRFSVELIRSQETGSFDLRCPEQDDVGRNAMALFHEDEVADLGMKNNC